MGSIPSTAFFKANQPSRPVLIWHGRTFSIVGDSEESIRHWLRSGLPHLTESVMKGFVGCSLRQSLQSSEFRAEDFERSLVERRKPEHRARAYSTGGRSEHLRLFWGLRPLQELD